MNARVLTLFAVGWAATSCQPYRACDPVDEEAVELLPSRLSETGLYEPGSSELVATEVRSYRPRFELWSDGAAKQRWLWLPPGTRIDSADADSWEFPVGTKLWKEFTRDSVRVETRLLQRLPSAWVGVAYAWLPSGDDAVVAPYGAIDARGTAHDVPAANECRACHGGRKSHVLGLSAVQLAPAVSPGDLDLEELAEQDLLSEPVPTPHVPGDETEQAALGYLHANCSHCHNGSRPTSPGARCFDPKSDLDFSLRSREASIGETNTYRTAREVMSLGHPEESELLDLVSRRGRFQQMPPLATEQVDQAAVQLLRRWLEAR